MQAGGTQPPTAELTLMLEYKIPGDEGNCVSSLP